LPYFNPHSFRKALAQLGEKLCRTPEQFKAWSQNLGHEKVLTTFSSYGEAAAGRQRDIIRELAQPIDPDLQLQEMLKQLMRGQTHGGVKQATDGNALPVVAAKAPACAAQSARRRVPSTHHRDLKAEEVVAIRNVV
jgi:hypothetical protein